MAQFASIWAVKTNQLHNAGEVIPVKLKSGNFKQVTLAKYLYSATRKSDGTVSHFYLAEKQDKED